MADWWRDHEVQMERGLASRPSTQAIAGPVLPSLPSFPSNSERQPDNPRWGSGAVAPQGLTKSQKKKEKDRQKQQQAQQPKAAQPYLVPKKGKGKGARTRTPT